MRWRSSITAALRGSPRRRCRFRPKPQAALVFAMHAKTTNENNTAEEAVMEEGLSLPVAVVGAVVAAVVPVGVSESASR